MPAGFRTSVILMTGLVWFATCRSAVLQKDDVREINTELEQSHYRARIDIRPEFATHLEEAVPPSFRRGALMKLRVEAAGNWARVRARPVSESAEQTPGTIIIYFFKDDLPDTSPEENRDILKGKILEMADPVVVK